VRRFLLVVTAIVVFVAVSALVARAIGAGTTARNEVTDLVKLESRGDARAVVARLAGCADDPACRDRTTALVRRVRGGGRVRILRLDGVSGFALGDRTETARVAWKAGTRLPVVQCIRVRRTGDPVSGYRVRLLSVSAPIGRESGC
jgi:hypothetical protein